MKILVDQKVLTWWKKSESFLSLTKEGFALLFAKNSSFVVIKYNQVLMDIFSTEISKAENEFPLETLIPKHEKKVPQLTTSKILNQLSKQKIFHGTITLNKSKVINDIELNITSTEFPNYYLASFCNLSLTRRYEDALRDSENRFQEIVEKAPWGISLFSVNGELIFTNQYNKPPPGVPLQIHQQMVQGLKILQTPVFIEPGIKDRFEKVFQGKPVLLAPFQFSLPYNQWDKNIPNRDIWLECNFYPVKDSDGKIKEIMLFHRDVSKSRKLEMKLRQLEKMEAIGQITGGIAHDFNNQLTGMQGFAELIQLRSEGNLKIQNYAEAILTSIKRAGGLTQQLLAFTRIQPQAIEKIDLHRIIEEVFQICIHTFPKNIRIHLRLEAQNFKVMGESSQIQNSILNLCINARDVMPNGGTLTLSTSSMNLSSKTSYNLHLQPPLQKSGKYLVVSVADTGSGIPDDILLRIWEPFFTTKEKGKGTGMGLATVYGTAKNHMGAVSVKSILEKGTEFFLYLPVISEEIATKKTSPLGGKMPTKKPSKILIFDDEKQIGELLGEMLRTLKIESDFFDKTKEGLKHFSKFSNQYQLILMDIFMPKQNGPELVPIIRKINPKIPILLMSGIQLNLTPQELNKMDVQGFLPKPFNLNSLKSTILPALSNCED
jgi:signal transduction histidine kinase/ActR/RegA family two-component response regulator